MKRYSLSLILFVLAALVFSGSVLADELTGKDILKKVDEMLSSDSRESEIKMIIVNEDGQKRERAIQIMTKGDNGLVKFIAPADVEGTALLARKENGEDNMWLYLPALGNVRKIASHMRNGSFMGTDFTYQDINMVGGEKYEDDYTSELIGTEVVDGDDCYVLDTIPINEDIEYSHVKMWIRKADYIPVKLDFFDEDGKLLKVMTNSGIKEVDGHLTPSIIEMKNIQENTRTILELTKIKYDVKLKDHIFTTRYLEKG